MRKRSIKNKQRKNKVKKNDTLYTGIKKNGFWITPQDDSSKFQP